MGRFNIDSSRTNFRLAISHFEPTLQPDPRHSDAVDAYSAAAETISLDDESSCRICVSVMNRVLSREHTISEQKVTVLPYYPKLGILPPGFDSCQPQQPIPADIMIGCNPELLNFIRKKRAAKAQGELVII
jgi:hypothetical protein